MGGQIDHQALTFIAEMFGVLDVEALFLDLVVIRDHMTSKE